MAGRRVERFLTTVLFTDIVGSTELAAELGDRGWRDLVQEHHKLVRAALRRHSGREVDTAGDSFFAVFDAPASGVECALDIAQAVAPLGIQVRAGLHVGEVEQIAGKVGGITVPIASRIMAEAQTSEVLVSGTVHDLAAGAGLTFEDRGTRQLKGVPGEWHLYSVNRSARPHEQQAGADGTADIAEASEPERAARRAATVRRWQTRPIWQRHPRVVAGVALMLAVVLATAGLLIWSPWLPPALAGVPENSVGVIDSGRNVIVGQAVVGNQPAAIAEGEGSVWVANAGDGTISRLDPRTHSVVDTIDVGKNPTGVTVGAGSVWVANSGERSVTRINAATGRVVDTIEVGNGPRSVAFGADAVWVANTGDGTVTRIDAATGVPGDPIRFASLPSALAANEAGVWVVSEDGGSVTHLDPGSGVALAAPITVGTRPSAVAIGDGVVWVANAGDGSISGIDPVNNRVTSVINVGGIPVALAVMGSTLWVGNGDASVERVNLASPSIEPVRIAAGSIPQAVSVVGTDLWFVSRASTATHRGGTIHVVGRDKPPVDPNAFGDGELRELVGDGLVGYRRLGGIAGTQLVPDLATALPRPTDGGLTYTFQLRPGLLYSDGSQVRPADFRFVLERVFQVEDPILGNGGAAFYSDLVGADACAEAPVERCDLSQGVVPDDQANTVTFHLVQPDPDFLFRLALPFAQAMREGSVPTNDLAAGPHPVTGPYQIAAASDTEVRLERNPQFQSWDAAARPDGYPDQIIWTSGIQPADQVAMVESGSADYMADQIPADAFSELRTQFTPQLHIASSSTTYLFMNTALAPFDRIEVRRAVNLAIDRAKVAELRGGAIAAQPTCQVLPPNFPGYAPYCPYTSEAGPSGRWTGPEVEMARSLVTDSGTAGMKVVVGPLPPRLTPVSEYVASVLRDLGYDATAEVVTDGSQVFKAIFEDQRVQIGGFEFTADFPAPDALLGTFSCDPGDPLTHYCDANLDSLIAQARGLQPTDPAAANSKWAEVDRMVADLAILAPLVNEGSDLVSARLGNYQFNPAIGVLLDQAWVN